MTNYNVPSGNKKKEDEKETSNLLKTKTGNGVLTGGSYDAKVENLPGDPTKENKMVNLPGDPTKENKIVNLTGTTAKDNTSGSSVVAPKVNTNENWSTDVNYFDPNMDYSLMMNNLMGQGADASVIRQLQTLRRNKAMSDTSLNKYYQDGTDIAAENYIKVRNLYENKRQRDIDAMMDRIAGRKSFEYDPEEDELYKSLKSQALKKGQKAMEDTLSRATQNAGGNNSYAISAAQGAYNDYLSGVDDLIPQLEQLAYSKYQDKVNEDYNMLSLQMALENQDYSRWSDAQTRDLQERQLQQDNFRYMQQWAYGMAQDEYNKAQSELDFDLKLASYGITPSGDRQKDIQALAEMIKLETLASKKVSTVKGGDGPEEEPTEKPDNKEEKEKEEPLSPVEFMEEQMAKDPMDRLKSGSYLDYLRDFEAKKDNGKIDVLGYGKISTEEVEKLMAEGRIEIVVCEDGSIEYRMTGPIRFY